ncbi:MAG: cation-translocating P-type ATPase [Opitutaceae bacterium]|nr:cation-translocating P-type ATPase [Verrucomicrobiales bacterium]
MPPPVNLQPESTSTGPCVLESMAQALDQDPALEAITINPADRKISIATMGRRVHPDLEATLSKAIIDAQEHTSKQDCQLLSGQTDCDTCEWGTATIRSGKLRIERTGNAMTLARVTCPTAPKFWRWNTIPWPRLTPRQVEIPDDEESLDEWKPQLGAALLCAVFGLAGYFLGEHKWASLGFFLLSYGFGSWFAAKEVIELLQQRKIEVHFLMLAVAAGSAAIGSWAEGATLLFLFSFSGALEHYALGRTQREIRALFKSAPKTARLVDQSGHESEIPVEQIRAGQKLLIKPGDQIPVDVEVIDGRTSCDESNLTGEALPVEKQLGDTLLSGTMNLTGAVTVTVLRPAGESALEKIIHLIKEAQNRKAPSQRFTDRFGSAYTMAALGLSFVMFLVWWLAFGLPPFNASTGSPSAFYRAMTLLVVASPCALVLSIPSAVLAAIAWSARRGLLFRGGEAVERLASIKVVALDKTGTLTTGDLKVERVESFPPGREEEVFRLACALERLSNHPLARAIVADGKRRQMPAVEVQQFESITGQGVQAIYQNTTVRLGRKTWLAQLNPDRPLPQVDEAGLGASEVWLATPELLGRIVLRDEIRPQARSVIEKLRQAGLKTVVLTGDRRASAELLKKELGLDDVRAELKPDDKVAAVEAFSKAGTPVAMIGDGVNDAPSLAVADVGVAMGARGSDAALEQADLVLMNDRLENFWAAFQLSQRAGRIIRQNLIISLGTVIVLVAFALSSAIPLTVGVVGHEGSTVIVVMNSLRLLFSKDRSKS